MVRRLSSFLVASALLLSGCSAVRDAQEETGEFLGTVSETTKESIDAARESVQKVQETAQDLKERADKIAEGVESIKQGLSGE